MEARKFATRVLENGILKIPELKNYQDQKVEVFVVIKPDDNNKQNNNSLNDFLTKWSGFFSTSDTNDPRYNYLIEKHK